MSHPVHFSYTELLPLRRKRVSQKKFTLNDLFTSTFVFVDQPWLRSLQFSAVHLNKLYFPSC